MKIKSYYEYTKRLNPNQIKDNAIWSKDIYCKIACQIWLAYTSQHQFECKCHGDGIVEWYTYSYHECKIYLSTKGFIFFIKKDKIYSTSICVPSYYFSAIVKHLVK